MWMWFLVKISIYHTFITSLLQKIIFWDENLQINHIVSKHGSYYVKWHRSTFIKTKNHLNYFWNIFVFFNTDVHYICFHKYIPISHFTKWNEIVSFLISCLNYILTKHAKIFQKFEVGYIQTCTSLESSTIWQSKAGHHSVLSPTSNKMENKHL